MYRRGSGFKGDNICIHKEAFSVHVNFKSNGTRVCQTDVTVATTLLYITVFKSVKGINKKVNKNKGISQGFSKFTG